MASAEVSWSSREGSASLLLARGLLNKVSARMSLPHSQEESTDYRRAGIVFGQTMLAIACRVRMEADRGGGIEPYLTLHTENGEYEWTHGMERKGRPRHLVLTRELVTLNFPGPDALSD